MQFYKDTGLLDSQPSQPHGSVQNDRVFSHLLKNVLSVEAVVGLKPGAIEMGMGQYL